MFKVWVTLNPGESGRKQSGASVSQVACGTTWKPAVYDGGNVK